MSTEENADDQLPFMDPFDEQQRRDEQLHNERIQSPHDRLINQTLQQIDVARALLSQHLPSEIAEHLLFETLVPIDASFIDVNLRRRFADRLFKVDVSTEIAKQLGMKVNYVYIFVLIDHKSTDGPHPLVQMLGYLVRIWENALANQQLLVPILPWVIYNGVGPWRSSRSLAELVPVPDIWKRYNAAMELAIFDVSRMEDSKMAGEPILQVALALLKYGRSSELESVLRLLFELLARSTLSKREMYSIRLGCMSCRSIPW